VVNQTFFRIGFFYVLVALALGMSVPHNSPQLIGAAKSKTSASTEHIHVLIQLSLANINIAASPFIIAIKLAHIQVLPDLVNALLLVFVLSATNSGKYINFIRRPSLTQSTLT